MSAFTHATLGCTHHTHNCSSLLPLPRGFCFIQSCLSCRAVRRERSDCGYLTHGAEKQLIMLTLSPPRQGDKLLFQFEQFPSLSIRRRTKHDISISCRVRRCKVITNKVLLLRLINNNNNSNGNDNNKTVPMCVTCWQFLSEIVSIDMDEFLFPGQSNELKECCLRPYFFWARLAPVCSQ